MRSFGWKNKDGRMNNDDSYEHRDGLSDHPGYMNAAEVRAHLRIPKTTFYKLRASGKFPAGKTWDPDAVRWVETRRATRRGYPVLWPIGTILAMEKREPAVAPAPPEIGGPVFDAVVAAAAERVRKPLAFDIDSVGTDCSVPDARSTAARLAAQIEATVAGRGTNYGPPEVNFANIAAFWRAWVKARHGIDVPLDGHDVGQMSALIKVARLAESPTHEDSALDAAIYVMLGHGCAVSADD